MALTATLVNVTPNELVYLISNEGDEPGTSLVIPAAGGATPDLVTDCVTATWGRAASARLRQVCRAGLDGLGTVAAGAWTQALARDLLSDNGATQAGSALMPRAELALLPLATGPLLAEATANVDGSGRPEIDITAAAVSGTAILRVRLRSTPGVK